MLSHQFKHSLTNHFLKLPGRIKPIILLCGLPIFLAAFSMYVAAEEVKTELNKAASRECTAIAERDSEKTKFVHDGNLIERFDKKIKLTEFSCLVSAEEVYEQWTKDKVLLIDVRRSSKYGEYWIPSSLNLAPFAIKAKNFLEDENIVLVNEGRSLTQLEKLCNQLKSQGLKSVGVMAGGLYSWYRSGYPIRGDNLAISKLNQITSAELLSALGERDWRFIDIDNSLPSFAGLFHAAEIIDHQPDTMTFISSVNKAVNGFKGDRMSGFIVASENGDKYKAMERLFRLTDAGNVFYLSGGIMEFKRYLRTHSAQVSRLARGFKEPHRCGG
jgi:rhodanese-related sulfurtransferase